MDLHDYLNVRRTFRMLAAEWNCPVWAAKIVVRRAISNSWEKARTNPEAAALWEKYFPGGKQPTPTEYILLLGHAHERGEEIPQILGYGEDQ